MQDCDLALSMVSKTCLACSCSRYLVLVFFSCQRKSSMMLLVASIFSSVVVVGERVKRGGVFVVKGHSFHEACRICCLTFDVLSKAKHSKWVCGKRRRGAQFYDPTHQKRFKKDLKPGWSCGEEFLKSPVASLAKALECLEAVFEC